MAALLGDPHQLNACMTSLDVWPYDKEGARYAVTAFKFPTRHERSAITIDALHNVHLAKGRIGHT
jgi:hypothetical protein